MSSIFNPSPLVQAPYTAPGLLDIRVTWNSKTVTTDTISVTEPGQTIITEWNQTAAALTVTLEALEPISLVKHKLSRTLTVNTAYELQEYADENLYLLWTTAVKPGYSLRDFAANPIAFTDSYTALDGIGTDDFTLSVDFTLLRQNHHGTINIGCISCKYYGYSTKGYQPDVRILKSDGTKGLIYPVGTAHIIEDVTSIKVIKIGQNVRMIVYVRDGSTVKDGTVAIPDGATVTSSSGSTTYPGNIFAASIRNDTTGTTVWQAPEEDLHDMVKTAVGVPAVLEPYNVIFDNDAAPVATVPSIPSTSNGLYVNVSDSGIYISVTPPLATVETIETPVSIRRINGKLPENGNIQIEGLGDVSVTVTAEE